MSLKDFEKWSMLTMTTVLPWDLRKSVMKSISMWDQGCCGMSLPTGSTWDTLACAYAEHEEMKWLISVNMLGDQYFVLNSWQEHWLLDAQLQEYCVISQPQRRGET